MRSVASVCLYVCVPAIHGLTFESADIETSSWCAGTPTSTEYLGQVPVSRSAGQGQRQGQGHRSRKRSIRA